MEVFLYLIQIYMNLWTDYTIPIPQCTARPTSRAKFEHSRHRRNFWKDIFIQDHITIRVQTREVRFWLMKKCPWDMAKIQELKMRDSKNSYKIPPILIIHNETWLWPTDLIGSLCLKRNGSASKHLSQSQGNSHQNQLGRM